MRTPKTVIIVTTLALLFAACGTDAQDTTATVMETTTTSQATTTSSMETTTTTGAETTTTTVEETTTTAEATGTVVAAADSDLGEILVDAEGMTLYMLTADSEGESTCDGQCASAWPPLLTDGDPSAEGAVDSSLLGTITREDGSVQVTYDGLPLYYFSGDSAAGDVNGQGIESFGGIWWVMAPDGEPIDSMASGSSGY